MWSDWNEMKWNEKPIVPWRAKASSFEGQLNVYACDELFRMHGCSIGVYAWSDYWLKNNLPECDLVIDLIIISQNVIWLLTKT